MSAVRLVRPDKGIGKTSVFWKVSCVYESAFRKQACFFAGESRDETVNTGRSIQRFAEMTLRPAQMAFAPALFLAALLLLCAGAASGARAGAPVSKTERQRGTGLD